MACLSPRGGSVHQRSSWRLPPLSAVIELAFGKPTQRIVDLPVDLDPLVDETRPRHVATLARNADFRYPRLARRGFYRRDAFADFAAVVVWRQKQIGLEGDEHVAA